MWQYNYENELYHHGILGMKWGKKNGPPYPLGVSDHSTSEKKAGWRKSLDKSETKESVKPTTNKNEYAVESNKSIKTNKDGSKTIPSGFVFNRVGKNSLDVNQSGGLYVSYGKEDAARYVKSLGPTILGKMLGTAGEAVQHISVKNDLTMPSDSETAKETAMLLMSNEKLFNSFKDSSFSFVVTGDFDKDVSKKDLERALKDPSGKDGQKLAYSMSSLLADPNYTNEAKIVYEHFRSKGYDAIPDLHDTLSGTSQTAMIVINPDKVEVSSTTMITKDVMKSAKDYVKSLEKLKVSELIDN